MYAENSAYFSSGVGGGATGLALAASTGISVIATVLIAVTVAFTLLLLVRITRRGLRTMR